MSRLVLLSRATQSLAERGEVGHDAGQEELTAVVPPHRLRAEDTPHRGIGFGEKVKLKLSRLAG